MGRRGDNDVGWLQRVVMVFFAPLICFPPAVIVAFLVSRNFSVALHVGAGVALLAALVGLFRPKLADDIAWVIGLFWP